MDVKQDLMTLCNAYGVSGDEFNVGKLAAEMLAPYVDRVEIDRFGNVVGYRPCGREGAKKLMLDAHIDQIGFLVTGVTDEGFLRFTAIGVDQRMLVGSELSVLTEDGVIPGVVVSVPPHIQQADEQGKAAPISKMAVDLGLPADEVKQRIKVGTYMAFSGDAIELNGDVISGKSMDDRACFISILYALELLKDKELGLDLIVTGSVQEEIGCKGARLRSFIDRPDIAIAVDVTHAHTPDARPADRAHKFGGGPVIGIGAQSNPRLARRMIEVARAKKIPHQVEAIPMRSGTNAETIQIAGEGAATMVLSLPIKYMHSPVETLKLSDLKNVSLLIKEVVLALAHEGVA